MRAFVSSPPLQSGGGGAALPSAVTEGASPLECFGAEFLAVRGRPLHHPLDGPPPPLRRGGEWAVICRDFRG